MKVLSRRTVGAMCVALVILGFAVFRGCVSPLASGHTVRFVTVISIPETFKLTRPFVDYMTTDGGTLYAAYASHGVIAMVNKHTNQVAAHIGGLGRIHGIAIDGDRDLGFASDGADNNVTVFDPNVPRILNKVALAADGPDAILYDKKARLVYVANKRSASGTLIDPATRSAVATIALGGAPEFCQADPATGLIYQNLEDTDEVVVIDPVNRTLVSRLKLPKGQSPTGLALDAANHRLFVTGTNKRLVVLNADNGAIIATLPIGPESDGVDYDPGLRKVYTANGFGSLTVIQQDDPDRYRVVETVNTRLGSHSVIIDPATHRLYLASFGSILVYDAVSRAQQ